MNYNTETLNHDKSSRSGQIEEHNAALVRRLFDEIVNRGNVRIVDELLAPDIVNHNPGPSDAPGREGIREVFWMLHLAFPDLRGHIDDLIPDGDRVVVRWTIAGTNTRRCMGIGPTGRSIQGTGIDILRVSGGRVVERWGNSDDMLMLNQMGLLEEVLGCPSFNPHVDRRANTGNCSEGAEGCQPCVTGK
jgi:predicted ester cyclase